MAIFGHGGGGVGEGEHRFGADGNNTVDNLVEAGEVVIARSLKDLVVVKEMVDTDELDLERTEELGNRANHISGLLAALG